MNSLSTNWLARALLLLILMQQTVVSYAVAPVVDVTGTNSISTHECAGMDMTTDAHHDAGGMQHDQEQCAEEGCFDCVGTIAFAASPSVGVAVPAPNPQLRRPLSNSLSFQDPDLLYRPPILH
jgi:hypothetical protein